MKGEKGASFLEALLAMALLSVFVSGVLTVFPRGFQHMKGQSMVGSATYLVRQKVDYYMSLGYNGLSGIPISRTEYLKGDGTDSVDNSSTTFTTAANYVRSISITNNATLNVYVLTVQVYRRHKTVSPGYDSSTDKPLAQIVTYMGNPGSPPP